MKLDWTEIQKGVNEELEKSSSLNKEAFAGNMAIGAGRLLGGAARWAAPYLKKMVAPVGKFVVNNPKTTALGGAMAVPYAGEKLLSPEDQARFLENSSLYSLANTGQRFVRGVGALGGAAYDAATSGAGAAGELSGAMADFLPGTPEAKPGDGLVEGIQRTGSGVKNLFTNLQGGVKGFREGLQNIKGQLGGLLDSANTGISSALSGMGDAGKYLPLGLGLLGGGLGGYLLSRRGNKGAGGYPQLPQSVVNINLGGRRRGGLLDYDDSGVGGLSSIKMGSISDSLTSAIGRRMADKVLNNAVGAPGPEAQPAQDPRALELTSKHPEIAEMLKNEQTKAYLEKLLKE
jgi:hypothetical protein